MHRKELDILRGISVLAVIAIHVTGGNYEQYVVDNVPLLWGFSFIHYISSFAVPMFLVISGIALSINYTGSFSIKKFYLRRINSVIPPYILFSLLYLLVYNWNNLSIQNFVAKVLFSTSVYYHFWFFALLFQLYLYYPIIIRLYEELKNSRYFNLMLAGLFILQVLFWLITPIRNIAILRYVFFFVIGIFLGSNIELISRIKFKTVIIPSLVLALAITFVKIDGLDVFKSSSAFSLRYLALIYLLSALLQLPLIFMVYKLSLLNLKTNNFLTSLGRNSFGIYLIHAMILDFLGKLLVWIGVNPQTALFYLTAFSITFLTSHILVGLIKRMPGGHYLVGS